MTRKPKTIVAVSQPHGAEPPKFVEADALAIKSLAAGNANEGQQKRALGWILKSACGISTWPYKENQRETDIALGRQFVAHQIVSLIDVPVSTFKEKH
jgi:hypothetical protein